MIYNYHIVIQIADNSRKEINKKQYHENYKRPLIDLKRMNLKQS